MTEAELQDTIRKLRAFAVELGMQWVLDEVDEAIAVGVPEQRTLRQTTRQGRTSYEDVTEPSDELPMLGEGRSRRTRRSEEFVRSRPMTTMEQAELLLEALRQVIVELDAVAVGCFDALAPDVLSNHAENAKAIDASGIVMPHVDNISFAPDDGSTAPAINLDLIRRSRRDTQVAQLFSQLRAEIDA
jgi:hypothetical protein